MSRAWWVSVWVLLKLRAFLWQPGDGAGHNNIHQSFSVINGRFRLSLSLPCSYNFVTFVAFVLSSSLRTRLSSLFTINHTRTLVFPFRTCYPPVSQNSSVIDCRDHSTPTRLSLWSFDCLRCASVFLFFSVSSFCHLYIKFVNHTRQLLTNLNFYL